MGDLPASGRPATYDDLLALPDHVVGEIVGGQLHVSPRLAVLAGDDDACVPPFTDITIPLASLWAD